MSDANRSQLTFVTESTWGTSPGTGMTEMRFTGESLDYTYEFETSKEIRDDRQITDLIQLGAEAMGGVNFELSYGSYDPFIASALFSTWSADLNIVGATCACNATTNAFEAPASTFDNVSAGQWIKTANFADAANNGFHRVLTVATGGATITVAETLVTEASIASAGVTGSMVRNATTQTSFALQRYHSDLSPVVYFGFNGYVPNTFSMSLAAKQIITGSFEFLGEEGLAPSNTTMSSVGTVTAANTNKVINAATNVANVMENNVAVNAALIQSLDFSLNNNLRALSAIGSLNNVDLGNGECNVTGNINAYFRNSDLYAKYIAGTRTALTFRTADAAGNTYIWTFPEVQFSADTVNSGSSNSDVMENIAWQALRDTTYDCTIQVDRFAA